jgi:hypothetical protein
MSGNVTGSSPYHPTFCEAGNCGAGIWFAITTAGHRSMPLNARSDPKGNVAVHQDASGTWLARVLRKNQEAAPFETVFMPHFATCPRAAEFRRAARKAQSDIARRRRNQRGRRPGRVAAAIEQPGLFRLPPGATR